MWNHALDIVQAVKRNKEAQVSEPAEGAGP
jgi:hypothetical protein